MQKKTIVIKLFGRFFLHLLFWSVVLLFFTYFFGAGSNNYDDTLLFSLCLMPVTIATTYVSIYKLIPYYLFTKRYLSFIIYSIYTVIISGYLIMVTIFFSLIYLAGFEYREMNPITRNIILVTTAVFLVVIIVSAFKLVKLNLVSTAKTSSLEKKILETQLKLKEQELRYLKMQIHPHFLFNTLNTLYGFALKKADETPEMILKLSNLLDYLLYQVDKPFVLLAEEINHIYDYIELEKMRFNNTLQVEFRIINIINSIKIAPMLLIPFVENSFKHGSIQNGVLNINIDLSCDEKQLYFLIENTHSERNKNNSGIGLENIKKRLELLYNNKYELKIEESVDNFKVTLKIDF
jgi:two-component system LytT family sensor kinase